MGVSLVQPVRELWKLGTLERVARGTPIALRWRIVSDAGGARWSRLSAQGSSAAYTVTAGTTLILTHIAFKSDVAAASFAVGYGDDDAGNSGVAAPTNAVYLSAQDGAHHGAFQATVAATRYAHDCYYAIPAGKLPFISAGLGTAVIYVEALGVEV